MKVTLTNVSFLTEANENFQGINKVNDLCDITWSKTGDGNYLGVTSENIDLENSYLEYNKIPYDDVAFEMIAVISGINTISVSVVSGGIFQSNSLNNTPIKLCTIKDV